MLTSVSSPTLQACSSGGRVIKQGLDNGDGSGTAQNGILEAGEVDYTTTYCSNFVLTRMADINSGSSGSDPGYFAGVTVMGTRLYFDANDGSSGNELWAHETTNSSTWQVADINSVGSSYPGQYAGLTVVGTRLYLDANDGSSGSDEYMMGFEWGPFSEVDGAADGAAVTVAEGFNKGFPADFVARIRDLHRSGRRDIRPGAIDHWRGDETD